MWLNIQQIHNKRKGRISESDECYGVNKQDKWFQRFFLTLATYHDGFIEGDYRNGGKWLAGLQSIEHSANLMISWIWHKPSLWKFHIEQLGHCCPICWDLNTDSRADLREDVKSCFLNPVRHPVGLRHPVEISARQKNTPEFMGALRGEIWIWNWSEHQHPRTGWDHLLGYGLHSSVASPHPAETPKMELLCCSINFSVVSDSWEWDQCP